MTSFASLTRTLPGLTPGESQQRSREMLADLVRQSPFSWWDVDRTSPIDNGLLVGVAVWSGYDMNMLDHVEPVVRQQSSGLPILVFNADDLQSQDQLDAILPGLGSLHHTPAVGLWRGGRLAETACGFQGRQLVARALNIDERPLHQYPFARPVGV